MRRIAAAATFLLLIVSLWSSVRIADFTVFDLFSPVCLLLCLACPSKGTVERDRDAVIVVISQTIFFFSASITTLFATSATEHISKFFVLISATLMMFGLMYVVRKREVLSYLACVSALAISATASSTLTILQGQFLLFRNIGRNLESDTLGVLRPTGLAEHPIEAGAVTAVGALICTALILSRRAAIGGAVRGNLTRIALAIALALNLYSMLFSASLTALFGFFVAFVAYLLFTRRYLFLLGVAIPAALALAPAIVSPDSLLGDRISKLLGSGSDYTTVQTRQEQMTETLAEIDAQTLLVGRGYTAAAVEGRDIHNALLAALFHFGILGLISQLLLLFYLFKKLVQNHSRDRRGLHLSLITVFLSLLLTGPVFARRSNWIAVVTTAAFLPALPQPRRREIRSHSIADEVSV